MIPAQVLSSLTGDSGVSAHESISSATGTALVHPSPLGKWAVTTWKRGVLWPHDTSSGGTGYMIGW